MRCASRRSDACGQTARAGYSVGYEVGSLTRGAQSAHIARKRFGQHFLVDQAVIEAIVRQINPRPGQAIVEVGPGLGALTQPLLERCGTLTVIELDRDLAARWRQRPGVTVIESDVLKVDFGALARQAGQALRVVGNLPYNISTPILFHLLAYAQQLHDQCFMLQKEVVERMVASPGCKAYGRLSVMLQWRYDIESVLDVTPQAFEPPPRVDSAVVRLQARPAQQPPVDEAYLREIVTLAFSQRRKLLRHTLGRRFEELGVSPAFDLQRRAEEVSVEQYLSLAAMLRSTAAP